MAQRTDPDAGTPADAGGVEVPRSHGRTWTLVGVMGAVAAIWFVLPGVLGMAAGSVAHLKGDRWGMPVAVASGVTTIVGMTLVFWVRG